MYMKSKRYIHVYGSLFNLECNKLKFCLNINQKYHLHNEHISLRAIKYILIPLLSCILNEKVFFKISSVCFQITYFSFFKHIISLIKILAYAAFKMEMRKTNVEKKIHLECFRLKFQKKEKQCKWS